MKKRIRFAAVVAPWLPSHGVMPVLVDNINDVLKHHLNGRPFEQGAN